MEIECRHLEVVDRETRNETVGWRCLFVYLTSTWKEGSRRRRRVSELSERLSWWLRSEQKSLLGKKTTPRWYILLLHRLTNVTTLKEQNSSPDTSPDSSNNIFSCSNIKRKSFVTLKFHSLASSLCHQRFMREEVNLWWRDSVS